MADDVEQVRAQLAAGADLKAIIVEAASAGRLAVMRYFLFDYRDARDRPLMLDRFTYSDVFAAALMHGHTDVADLMLVKQPGEIDDRSRSSRKIHNAFAHSIATDDVTTFDWLIAHHVKPYRAELRAAIERGATHMVESMLRVGAEHAHVNVERIRSPAVRAAIERWRVDEQAFDRLIDRGFVHRVAVFERHQASALFSTPGRDDVALAARRAAAACVDDANRIVWTRTTYTLRRPFRWPRPDAWEAGDDRFRDGLQILTFDDEAHDDFLTNENYHALLARRDVQGYESATLGIAVFYADRWLEARSSESWSAGRVVDELVDAARSASVDEVLARLQCTREPPWLRDRIAARLASRNRQPTIDRWLVKRPRTSASLSVRAGLAFATHGEARDVVERRRAAIVAVGYGQVEFDSAFDLLRRFDTLDNFVARLQPLFGRLSHAYATVYRGTVWPRLTRDDDASLLNYDRVLFFTPNLSIAEDYALRAIDDANANRVGGGSVNASENQIVATFSTTILERIGRFYPDNLDCPIEEWASQFDEADDETWILYRTDGEPFLYFDGDSISAYWSAVHCGQTQFRITSGDAVTTLFESLLAVQRVDDEDNLLTLSGSAERKKDAIFTWAHRNRATKHQQSLTRSRFHTIDTSSFEH